MPEQEIIQDVPVHAKAKPLGRDAESAAVRHQYLKTILFPERPDEEDPLRAYAVMEAGAALNGATSKLVAALEDYGAPVWSSLLRVDDDTELLQLAPYLIELEIDDDDEDSAHAGLTQFADWLLSQPDMPGWGYFVRSRAGFDSVFDFFARMAVVELDNGEHAFFRFASPKVFSTFFSNQSAEELTEMTSMLEDIYLFDPENYNVLIHVARNGQTYIRERSELDLENKQTSQGDDR